MAMLCGTPWSLLSKLMVTLVLAGTVIFEVLNLMFCAETWTVVVPPELVLPPELWFEEADEDDWLLEVFDVRPVVAVVVVCCMVMVPKVRVRVVALRTRVMVVPLLVLVVVRLTLWALVAVRLMGTGGVPLVWLLVDALDDVVFDVEFVEVLDDVEFADDVVFAVFPEALL